MEPVNQESRAGLGRRLRFREAFHRKRPVFGFRDPVIHVHIYAEAPLGTTGRDGEAPPDLEEGALHSNAELTHFAMRRGHTLRPSEAERIRPRRFGIYAATIVYDLEAFGVDA